MPFSTRPRVLFVYARSSSGLLIAGRENRIHKVISLSGATSALVDFEGYKPVTPEALVRANPDVFLLFEEGMGYLEDGRLLFRMPGVAQTTAGKKQQVVAVEGQLLSGFGPRVGEAALLLNSRLHEVLSGEAQ